jgi:hypothetical protein
VLEGGSSPDERQASFLELALCLAGGLPDAALDPLFAVSCNKLCCFVKAVHDIDVMVGPG